MNFTHMVFAPKNTVTISRTGERTRPVKKALLRLTPKSFGNSATVHVGRVLGYPMIKTGTNTASDWIEDEITHNMFELNPVGTFWQWSGYVVDQPFEVDLTNAVNNAIARDEPLELGLFSRFDIGPRGGVAYYSREASDPTKRPQLILID